MHDNTMMETLVLRRLAQRYGSWDHISIDISLCDETRGAAIICDVVFAIGGSRPREARMVFSADWETQPYG